MASGTGSQYTQFMVPRWKRSIGRGFIIKKQLGGRTRGAWSYYMKHMNQTIKDTGDAIQDWRLIYPVYGSPLAGSSP